MGTIFTSILSQLFINTEIIDGWVYNEIFSKCCGCESMGGGTDTGRPQPIDCQVSDWTNDGQCEVKSGATCGSNGKIAGNQRQTRTVTTQPAHG